MIATVKILHLLAMAVGIGGGVANALVAATARTAPPESRPFLGAASRRIGQGSLIAILVLWITGLIMMVGGYAGGAEFTSLAWSKVLLAVVLTVISGYLNYLSWTAYASKTPPPAETMRKLGMAATGIAVLIVVLAVIAFG